jgi:hypothetical protein
VLLIVSTNSAVPGIRLSKIHAESIDAQKGNLQILCRPNIVSVIYDITDYCRRVLLIFWLGIWRQFFLPAK